MKQRLLIFLSLLLFVPAVFARTYSLKDVPNVQLSDASRYTSNPDGILSEGAVMAIDKACDSLHNIGRAQVAVVVVEDIDSDDVFTFAHSLFSSWGVGGRESDNGLGIILVTQKREIRFVTGYGLEGVLTDAMCKRIQQRYMVSHLSKGDYDTGMVEGVAAVAHIISQSGEIDLDQDEADVELLWFMAVFMAFIILIIVVAVVVEWYSRKCPKCGKHHLKMQSSSILSSTKKYDVTTICDGDCQSKSSSGKSNLDSISARIRNISSFAPRTFRPSAPESCRSARRNAASDFAPIRSATASASVKSILPFRNARLVNSPGSARRAPLESRRERIRRGAQAPP